MLLHTPAVVAFGIPCVRPNGVAVVEFWVIRLPTKKKVALRRLYVARGKLPVPLRWSAVQLDVHVDGCGHGKEVVVLDGAIRFVGPDLRQVDDLKCKFTGPLCLIANCRAVGG